VSIKFASWHGRGFLQWPQQSGLFRPRLNGNLLNCEVEDLKLEDAEACSSFGLLTYSGLGISQIIIPNPITVEVSSVDRDSIPASTRIPIIGAMTLGGREEATYYALNRHRNGKPVELWLGWCIEDTWLVKAAPQTVQSDPGTPYILWRTSRLPAWNESDIDHTTYPPVAFYNGDEANSLTIVTSSPPGDDEVSVPTTVGSEGYYAIETEQPSDLAAEIEEITLRYPALLYVRIRNVSRSLDGDGFQYQVDFEEVMVT